MINQVRQKKFHYGDKWRNIKSKLNSCTHGLLRWKKKEVGSSDRELKQKTKLLETLQGTDGDSDRPKMMEIQKRNAYPS